MKKQYLPVLFTFIILVGLGLTACSATAPDMPMEAVVDGQTIVLGQTTMQDMVDLGYEAHLEKVPDSAKTGDKYIYYNYSLDMGAGRQVFVTVGVPWSGDTDISNETSLSATEGIIKSISLSKTATEKITVSYNGVDLQDLSFDYAATEWGAKEKEGASKKTYTLPVKRGMIQLQAYLTSDEDFNSLDIQLSEKEFEKMQKS